MKNIASEIISKLKFAGAVEFGYQAFGISGYKLKRRFAIIESNFNKLIENTTLTIVLKNKDQYSKIVPAFSSIKLVEIDAETSIEVLLFKNQKCIDTISNSVKDVCKLPKYLYTTSYDRSNLFRETLLKHGFVHSNFLKRIVYSPMRIVNLFK